MIAAVYLLCLCNFDVIKLTSGHCFDDSGITAERDCTRRQVQTFTFFHAATDEEAHASIITLAVGNSEYHLCLAGRLEQGVVGG